MSTALARAFSETTKRTDRAVLQIAESSFTSYSARSVDFEKSSSLTKGSLQFLRNREGGDELGAEKMEALHGSELLQNNI